MKKRYLFPVLILLLFVFGYFFYVRPLLNIYVGFSAKTACSCHFIQNRTIEDIKAHELSVAAFINNSIDTEKKLANASFLGVQRSAVYRPGMGCTLVSERTVADILQHDFPIKKIKKEDILPTDVSKYPALAGVIATAFEEPYEDKAINTRAIIVIKDSVIVGEQYAKGYAASTPQMGWSMTKSVTNALVGILVKKGKLNIDTPARVGEWYVQKSDPRGAITLDHLLRMSSGLYFEEEYDKPSTVNQMLWTKADAGKVGYSQQLAHPVDSVWYYSSGTTNIVMHLVRQQFDDYDEYLAFPYEDLFYKIGMTTAVLETDANGTYVGSSLLYASPRDWARFGLLYLQDGVWNGERILPEGWVDYSKRPTPNLHPYSFYGAQFWLNAQEDAPDNLDYPKKWKGVPSDAYYASGFEGQTVLIIPSENVVIVRLGQTLDRTAWDMGAFAAKVLNVLR